MHKSFCPMIRKHTPCFVMLGKTGDLISLLPAWQEIARTSGMKPVVMVNEKFAKVLEGVSYVEPWIVNHQWPKDIGQAWEKAREHFHSPAMPQFWNETSLPPDGVFGVNLPKYPNSFIAMWKECGFDEKQMLELPVIFDQRDREREKRLAGTVSSWKKPVVLYNLEGASCPFTYAAEVLSALWPMRSEIELVDLARITAERVYDLLGLYDRAVGLITIDTATLHLAGAGNIPYIALVNDGWSRAVPKGNVQLTIPYAKTLENLHNIASYVRRWSFTAKTAREHYDVEKPPSILHQTPWPVRFIDELPDDAEYFNCGLVERPDGLWLVARRALPAVGHPYGVNSLKAFKLKGGKVCDDGIPVKMISLTEDEHFEDPRIVYDHGRTWISCCNFVWGKTWTGAHQILTEVSNGWQCIRRYDVHFGKNGNHVGRNTGMEKNWLWFWHEGSPWMIYGTYPHHVVKFDGNFNQLGTTQDHAAKPCLALRRAARGTSAGSHRRRILVILSFLGQLAGDVFAALSHGRVCIRSQAPLLDDPLHDDAHPIRQRPAMSWAHPKPLVVFPCGAVLKDGKWTISMGVNDLTCALMELPHSELLKQMTTL